MSTVLNNMVQNQLEKPSPRLLKHIIRCYNRLSENPRALIALRENMPIIVKDAKLFASLDESSKKCLKNLYDSTFVDATTASDTSSLKQEKMQSFDDLSSSIFGSRSQTPLSEQQPQAFGASTGLYQFAHT